jgi:hypothetical protein
MTDRKSSMKPQPPKRKRNSGTGPLRAPADNELILKTSWTYSSLDSGTSGTISSVYAPSLQLSSENSTYQSLFTEVRLISCAFTFIPIRAGGYGVSTTHSAIHVGTNMIANHTTNTPPTTAASVFNLNHLVLIASAKTTPTVYRMTVPKGLLFLSSATAEDVPATPNPYAGSPGAVYVHGANFTNSLSYFHVFAIARFHLRGRQ